MKKNPRTMLEESIHKCREYRNQENVVCNGSTVIDCDVIDLHRCSTDSGAVWVARPASSNSLHAVSLCFACHRNFTKAYEIEKHKLRIQYRRLPNRGS